MINTVGVPKMMIMSNLPHLMRISSFQPNTHLLFSFLSFIFKFTLIEIIYRYIGTQYFGINFHISVFPFSTLFNFKTLIITIKDHYNKHIILLHLIIIMSSSFLFISSLYPSLPFFFCQLSFYLSLFTSLTTTSTRKKKRKKFLYTI